MNINESLGQSALLLEERCKSTPHSAELRVLRLHQEALEALSGTEPKRKAPKKSAKSSKAKAKATETETPAQPGE